ncbi:hypothetical protein HDV06_003774 [Boothiomyces sp. JEL0866]|nr:hypothetical protein HDV06_003774 [Boothiomyces sp. JEL0866]
MNTTVNREDDLHNTDLLLPPEKYKIKEKIPRTTPKDRLSPTCSQNYLFQLTKTWDKGNKAVRERILKEFVENNQNATGPQLEKNLNNGASLFLTRISAWLRLTYLLGHDLALQLRAITVFVAAASGNRFLTEFLEMDRAEALHLLIKVASNGRKYKEFICESYGVRQVTECLSKSRSEVTQDYARNLLVQLGTGNPKFQIQVFKGLQSLLSSPAVAPTSQQMAAQALRILLTSTQSVPTTLIDPAANLLRSQHMQVQYEGYELLSELVNRPNCQEPIIVILVAILRNVFDNSTEDTDRHRAGQAQGKETKQTMAQWAGLSTEDAKEKERILSGYIQQAYATKLVGILIASGDELAEKLIKHQVVSALLNVVANAGHPESQKYATSNLVYLVDRFDYVAKTLKDHMGQNFFELLENKPDTFYRELTKEQIRYLRRNNVKIRTSDTQEKVVDSEEESDSDDENTTKRHFVAFPSAQTKEEKEVVEEPAKVVQPTTAENELKLQQQIILDSYEKTETAQPKAKVEDMYTQFLQTGLTATFPVNKYTEEGSQMDKEQYEADLRSFQTQNRQRKEQKQVFEPKLEPRTVERMEALRKDTHLFTHEKMLKDIDKYLNVSGMRPLMSTEDQAMLSFETELLEKQEDEVEYEEEIAPEVEEVKNVPKEQDEFEDDIPMSLEQSPSQEWHIEIAPRTPGKPTENNEMDSFAYGKLADVRKLITVVPFSKEQKLEVIERFIGIVGGNIRAKKENAYSEEFPKHEFLCMIDDLKYLLDALSDTEFHYKFSLIIAAIKDVRHMYIIPGYHAYFKLYLPVGFHLEQTNDVTSLYVSKFSEIDKVLAKSPQYKEFSIGDQVILINGQTADQYIKKNQYISSTSSIPYAHSIVAELFIRNCAKLPVPNENEVQFVMKRKNGTFYQAALQWVAECNVESFERLQKRIFDEKRKSLLQ